MKRRISHNNLLPWFTEDHGRLPASYLASCQKFFRELQAASFKRQASGSCKRQAPGCKRDGWPDSGLTGDSPCVTSRIIKDKL